MSYARYVFENYCKPVGAPSGQVEEQQGANEERVRGGNFVADVDTPASNAKSGTALIKKRQWGGDAPLLLPDKTKDKKGLYKLDALPKGPWQGKPKHADRVTGTTYNPGDSKVGFVVRQAERALEKGNQRLGLLPKPGYKRNRPQIAKDIENARDTIRTGKLKDRQGNPYEELLRVYQECLNQGYTESQASEFVRTAMCEEWGMGKYSARVLLNEALNSVE